MNNYPQRIWHVSLDKICENICQKKIFITINIMKLSFVTKIFGVD